MVNNEHRGHWGPVITVIIFLTIQTFAAGYWVAALDTKVQNLGKDSSQQTQDVKELANRQLALNDKVIKLEIMLQSIDLRLTALANQNYDGGGQGYPTHKPLVYDPPFLPFVDFEKDG